MKILHIVEDFSIKSGGLRTVIKNLNIELQKMGYGSYILSSDKEKEDEIYIVDAKNKPWMYSKQWKQKLNEVVSQKQINIIHIHGVWLYPHYLAAKFALKNKIPFVLSIHGMYEPWLWKKGTLKKTLYFHLLVKKLFVKAAVIHTITPFETKNVITLFKKPSIVEIPNLIHIPKKEVKTDSVTKYILYLGRLDEKKGIKLLIKALKKIDNNEVILKIAGESNSYKEELKMLINNLGLQNRVSFLGLVKKNKKIKIIKEAFILVAPSYSEVIGMVNLEAAVLKTPVITTYQTGLNTKWNENGGKLINPNVNELTENLNEILNWSIDKRNKEGEKLYRFVSKNYSWEGRINDWIQLYKTSKNEI